MRRGERARGRARGVGRDHVESGVERVFRAVGGDASDAGIRRRRRRADAREAVDEGHAQRLVEVGNGGGGGLDLYDHAMASFIVAFEEDVKARVISIYARPKSSAIAGDVAAWEKTAGEDDAAHAGEVEIRAEDARGGARGAARA